MKMRWSGHVARMEKKRNAHIISVGKFERKISVAKLWRRRIILKQILNNRI
jgi:hypothetical protein